MSSTDGPNTASTGSMSSIYARVRVVPAVGVWVVLMAEILRVLEVWAVYMLGYEQYPQYKHKKYLEYSEYREHWTPKYLSIRVKYSNTLTSGTSQYKTLKYCEHYCTSQYGILKYSWVLKVLEALNAEIRRVLKVWAVQDPWILQVQTVLQRIESQNTSSTAVLHIIEPPITRSTSII